MKNGIRSVVVAAALAAPILPAMHVFAAGATAEAGDTGTGGGDKGAGGSGGSSKKKKGGKKSSGGAAGSGG